MSNFSKRFGIFSPFFPMSCRSFPVNPIRTEDVVFDRISSYPSPTQWTNTWFPPPPFGKFDFPWFKPQNPKDPFTWSSQHHTTDAGDNIVIILPTHKHTHTHTYTQSIRHYPHRRQCVCVCSLKRPESI